MQLLASLFLLGIALQPLQSARAAGPTAIVGDWTGTATSHGQQVPMHLRIAGSPSALQASLVNGPQSDQASAAGFDNGHLHIAFSYFARTIDATLSPDGKLKGSFGTATVRYPIALSRSRPEASPARDNVIAAIAGDWEIAVKSAKDESAWQLRIDPSPTRPLPSRPSSSASTAIPARSTANARATSASSRT